MSCLSVSQMFHFMFKCLICMFFIYIYIYIYFIYLFILFLLEQIKEFHLLRFTKG